MGTADLATTEERGSRLFWSGLRNQREKWGLKVGSADARRNGTIEEERCIAESGAVSED